MRVGPMTPTVRVVLPSIAVQAIRLNDAGRVTACSVPMTTVRPGTVDVRVEQMNHPLLLFHHLEQRAERGHRHALVRPRVVEQRGRAFNVERLLRWAAPRASSGPAAARAPAAGRRACAPAAAAAVTASRTSKQRQAGKLRVEIVGRLRQVVGAHASPASTTFCVTWLLRATTTTRICEPPSGTNSMRCSTARVVGGQRKAHMLRRARHQVRHAGEQIVHQRGRPACWRSWCSTSACGRTASGSRAAGRRTRDSRGRSEPGRLRCAAGGRSQPPRAAPARCEPWPTTHRARFGARAPATTPARPSRCTRAPASPAGAATVR